MFAKKCDRCGKLYEIATPKLLSVRKTEGNVMCYGIGWILHSQSSEIDLCPDCLTSFKDWFERSK